MDQDEQTFLDLTRDLDIREFWAENEQCWDSTPQKPRCPLILSPDDHWLFGFIPGISTLRYYHDKPYRDSLHRRINLAFDSQIGRRYFEEDTWTTSSKRIENLFGCEFAYTEGGTPWLVPATNDPVGFARILDQAEAANIRTWAFPEPFQEEWARRKAHADALPDLGTGSRGPATIMTSTLHPETVFYWMVDFPGLMRRFRDLLASKMVELNRALRAYSGYAQDGWWITDDNCALFNRRYYQEYCKPVLQKVLQEFAPPGSRRYQHSDSAMAHLLDDQHDLGITDCNYGPTVDAGLIRQKLPEAVIQGQLPPMLLRNGSPEAIRARVRSDFLKAGASGRLHITTAGSLSSGTSLGRVRWLMKVVREECRYR